MNKDFDFTKEEKEYLASLDIDFDVNRVMTLEQKHELIRLLDGDSQNQNLKRTIIEKMED